MELRQLEYFRTASRLNNITRAAEQLYVSQPNITVAIKKLEEELGVKLFDRQGRKLALTPEGAVFLQKAEEILNCAEDALNEMNDFRELEKGKIRMGIPPMLGSYLFPRIFSGFRKIYPGLSLITREDGSLKIREKIKSGELDLGIVILEEIDPALEISFISGMEIVVCMPENHPLASLESVDAFDLENEPLIMLGEGTYHRKVIMEEFGKNGIEPEIMLTSNQTETIKNLVVQGSGISFLFNAVAAGTPGMVTRSFENPLHVRTGLAWNRERYLSRASRVFIKFAETMDYGFNKNKQ